ncbi:MAG: tRNA (cytidine(34)-2'-O)-methyltransferase [Gammaproteobacteria bacterium]|nr:tRNA (cytidine(34)-2'-O)-methyltransferase [Gammaproteobacteria bacterium]
MFHIALFEPRIAPNTGNIIRLCANNGCRLHLIGSLGFVLEDKQLRRAGLDYHDLSNVSLHADYQAFCRTLPGQRIIACTTRGRHSYDQLKYQPGDVLLFGSETSGLPQFIHDSLADEHKIKIPMIPSSRSLNLSNAVAIISYEAWRQHGFTGCGMSNGVGFN